MKTPIVFPTVTAANPHVYRDQLELALRVAGRAHIDVSDGIFSPTKMIDPQRLWVPEGSQVDVHLMVEKPLEILRTIIALSPRSIITHSESQQSGAAIEFTKKHGIAASLGILPGTSVSDVAELVKNANEVMIFGGKLGSMGGDLDEGQIQKVKRVKAINPGIIVSWDGGISPENIAELAHEGVDIFYIGGAIHRAGDPSAAYDDLITLVAPK